MRAAPFAVLFLLGLVATAAPLVAAEGARPIRARWVAEDEVKLTVRLEFRGAVTPALVARWERGIEETWNGKARKPRMAFHVRTRIRRREEPPTPGYHQVRVVSGACEVAYWLLDRERPDALGAVRALFGARTQPNGSSGGDAGRWIDTMTPTMAAMQFGRLLGVEHGPDHEVLLEGLIPFRDLVGGERPNLMHSSWYPRAEPRDFHYGELLRNARRHGWFADKL
ncbi:MAG: hypothetical protein HYZ53_03335 [Planctomycetes bacterium]|nr:hypothetical protein [Planctomycetota bacterium]